MKLSTIIEYVKRTPFNTNKNILTQMIQDYIDNPEEDEEGAGVILADE